MSSTFRRAALGAALVLCSVHARADFAGFLNGRTADLGTVATRSVEATAVTGNHGEDGYEHLGLRYNHRLNAQVTLFGNVGKTRVGRGDGTSYGIGAYYALGPVAEGLDLALKGSFTKADLGTVRSGVDGGTYLDCTATNTIGLVPGIDPTAGCIEVPVGGGSAAARGEYEAVVMELLFSGRRTAGQRGMRWYGNVGVRADLGDSNDDTRFTFGGGVVLPWRTGELYGGADMIDELQFGIGYRHFID